MVCPTVAQCSTHHFLTQSLLLQSALYIPAFQAQRGSGEGPTITERLSSALCAHVFCVGT